MRIFVLLSELDETRKNQDCEGTYKESLKGIPMINVLGREVAALETFEQQFKELSWNHDEEWGIKR